MSRGIIQGVDAKGFPKSLGATPDGELESVDAPLREMLKLLLIQTTAIRIGLEMVLEEQPGTLLELAAAAALEN